ncbi:MAG: ion transporter [Atopobiaceae bacterium]|nr:ion transporter [Atopobiaceae bacterium]
MREKINQLVNPPDESGTDYYDLAMIVIIVASLVPLAFKQSNLTTQIIEFVATLVFTVDYILRWITADLRRPDLDAKRAFLTYPVSPMAIVDLLSLLPGYLALNQSLRFLRSLRLLRLARLAKAFRYSKSMTLIGRVIHRQRASLGAVAFIAVVYLIVSALVVFNAEPDSFDSFFEALYWATISLTTIGYGDLYPVSVLGRLFSMISALFGIAVVALPAGIITAGLMQELEDWERDDTGLSITALKHLRRIPHKMTKKSDADSIADEDETG